MNENFYRTKFGAKIARQITSISENLIAGKYIDLEKSAELVGKNIDAYYEGYLSSQRHELRPWHPAAFPDESILNLDDGSYVIRAILPSFVNGQQVDSGIRLMIEVSKEGELEFKGLTY